MLLLGYVTNNVVSVINVGCITESRRFDSKSGQCLESSIGRIEFPISPRLKVCCDGVRDIGSSIIVTLSELRPCVVLVMLSLNELLACDTDGHTKYKGKHLNSELTFLEAVKPPPSRSLNNDWRSFGEPQPQLSSY